PQLLVYHFMFAPDYTAGCPACSTIADGFNGFAVHLAHHDVMLWAVSRAPLAKLQAYKRRMGWTFPWASSSGSDFNRDFNAWFSVEQQREGGIEYNYRREPAQPVGNIPSRTTPDGPTTFAAMCGTDSATYTRERPGMSAFALDAERGAAGAACSSLATGAGLGAAMRGMDTAGAGIPMTRMAQMAPGWTPGYTALMLGMWTVMMTPMMLPSAAPAVLRMAGRAGLGPAD